MVAAGALARHEQGKVAERHSSRLRAASAQVQAKWRPADEQKHDSMRRNGKREQKHEERQQEIERENNRLLNRFHEIGRPQAKPPGLRRASSCGPPKTLNGGLRRKQLQSITDDNQRILKRLQSVKSSVNMGAKAQAKDHARHKKLVEMRCQVAAPRPPRGSLQSRAQMGAFERRLEARLQNLGLGDGGDEQEGLDGRVGAEVEAACGLYPAAPKGFLPREEVEAVLGLAPKPLLREVPDADAASTSASAEAESAEAEPEAVASAPADAALAELMAERAQIDAQIAALGA